MAKAAPTHGYRVQYMTLRSSAPYADEDLDDVGRSILSQLRTHEASDVERTLVEQSPWLLITSLSLADTQHGTGVVSVSRDGGVTSATSQDAPLQRFVQMFKQTLASLV